jgi:hypothetical protein
MSESVYRRRLGPGKGLPLSERAYPTAELAKQIWFTGLAQYQKCVMDCCNMNELVQSRCLMMASLILTSNLSEILSAT